MDNSTQLTTDETIALIRAEGLNMSFMGKEDDGAHFTVAGEAGRQEGYGPFYQKGIVGWGKTLFAAYIDYKRRAAEAFLASH